jgi:hypothetical protein
VTAAEFAELPFGGHAGEWLSGGRATPAPPLPQPLVIEPPPWAGQEADPLVRAPVSEQRPDALSVMRAWDDDADRWPDPTVSVEVVAPLVRPLPPPPDWRAEEAERQRQRAAEAQAALEPAAAPTRCSEAPGRARASRENRLRADRGPDRACECPRSVLGFACGELPD